MFWIFTGVFAPELVIFTAWRQCCSARLLGKLVRELQRETDDDVKMPAKKGSAVATVTLEILQSVNSSPRKHAWSITHDFFASTGGFALEIVESMTVYLRIEDTGG